MAASSVNIKFPTHVLAPEKTTGKQAQDFIDALDMAVLACSADFEQMQRVAANAYTLTAFSKKFNAAPPAPFPVLDAPSGTGAAAVLRHQEDKAKRKEVEQLTHSIRQQFLGLLDANHQRLMLKPGDDRLLVVYPIWELKERFLVVFGEFRTAELISTRQDLKTPLGGEPMAAHIYNFNKNVAILAQANRTVNDPDQVADLAASVGGYSGPYQEALKDFSKRPVSEQTIANLQADITKEHTRQLSLPASAHVTASNSGFAAAAAVAPAAPPTPAATTTAGGANNGGGGRGSGGSNNGGRGNNANNGRGGNPNIDGGRLCSLQLIRAPGRGRVVGINVPTHYCPSHGPHAQGYGGNAFVPHDARDCRNKEPYHDDTATFADIKGGRRRFCADNERGQFPHK